MVSYWLRFKCYLFIKLCDNLKPTMTMWVWDRHRDRACETWDRACANEITLEVQSAGYTLEYSLQKGD